MKLGWPGLCSECCVKCGYLTSRFSTIVVTFSGITACTCATAGGLFYTVSATYNAAYTLNIVGGAIQDLRIPGAASVNVYTSSTCSGTPINSETDDIIIHWNCADNSGNPQIQLSVVPSSFPSVYGGGIAFSAAGIPVDLNLPVSNDITGPCTAPVSNLIAFGGTATLTTPVIP